MSGRVHLVGAGPGDAGLLTVRALELIARADVILHDRLIGPEALSGARADAELLYVGKEGGGAAVPQERTEALMIERARAGRTVVRLKGGDPFVFGRGGEEAQALRAAGIPFEVVPGVSSGIAAPAYAGIAVTHRDAAGAVALVTAHEAERELDWQALAAFPGTLVLYMGVARLGAVCERLIAAGRSGAEPAAVIERGTLPGQREVIGTLGDIAGRAAAAEVKPPAVTVIGAVVALRVAWRERPPLAGRRVAVTRARAQASGLADRLRELGARVIEVPAIRVVARDVQLPEFERFDLLCVTSANGVELLFDRLAERGQDARALAGMTVAAIGAATERALAARGIAADVVPQRAVAESLVEAIAGLDVKRALIARAARGRDVLPDALRARGAEVEIVALYDTVAEPLTAAQQREFADADYVTFTSSSTVGYLLEAAQLGDRARIVSIGPVTSATLREHGLAPHVEARRHDIDGMIEALVEDARAGGEPLPLAP